MPIDVEVLRDPLGKPYVILYGGRFRAVLPDGDGADPGVHFQYRGVCHAFAVGGGDPCGNKLPGWPRLFGKIEEEQYEDSGYGKTDEGH